MARAKAAKKKSAARKPAKKKSAAKAPKKKVAPRKAAPRKATLRKRAAPSSGDDVIYSDVRREMRSRLLGRLLGA